MYLLSIVFSLQNRQLMIWWNQFHIFTTLQIIDDTNNIFYFNESLKSFRPTSQLTCACKSTHRCCWCKISSDYVKLITNTCSELMRVRNTFFICLLVGYSCSNKTNNFLYCQNLTNWSKRFIKQIWASKLWKG